MQRDEFRESVFARDGYLCVVCKAPAVDAHHIIERRLFPDGGYYLDNGASVCATHHMEAEQTQISCRTLRELIGATTVVLPPHLYRDVEYTKWGDIIQLDGTRIPGELFEDESVQKVLAPVLWLYRGYRKYPRTYHLPNSPVVGKDDRRLEDTSIFGDVVVTEKMDGENTTVYSDGYCHARSIDSGYHPSRERMKALAAEIGWQLPRGWRVCGENMTAVHTIEYEELPHFFFVFSVWNERNECLSWEETEEWAALLGLMTVPVLYRGPWHEHGFDFTGEGYVVRNAGLFHYKDFRRNVGKYVDMKLGPEVHNWMMQQPRFNRIAPNP